MKQGGEEVSESEGEGEELARAGDEGISFGQTY